MPEPTAVQRILNAANPRPWRFDSLLSHLAFAENARLAVLGTNHLDAFRSALERQAERHDATCLLCDLEDCSCGNNGRCTCGARFAAETLRDLDKAAAAMLGEETK